MRAGSCVHWTGRSLHQRNAKCDGGVPYAAMDGDKAPGIVRRLPCFADNASPSFDCPKQQFPTPEEVEASEKAFRAHVDKVMAALVVIEPWRTKHRGKSHAEVVPCPACEGRLHLSISAVNSHVHGRCETDNCISWME